MRDYTSLSRKSTAAWTVSGSSGSYKPSEFNLNLQYKSKNKVYWTLQTLFWSSGLSSIYGDIKWSIESVCMHSQGLSNEFFSGAASLWETVTVFDSFDGIQRSPTSSCWKPKWNLISDSSVGMLFSPVVQLHKKHVFSGIYVVLVKLSLWVW